MPNGGILRQSLRLVSTMAVRNILACRYAEKDKSYGDYSKNKNSAILKFIHGALEEKDPQKGITNIERLLQEIDLQRLKGIVYRDMVIEKKTSTLIFSKLIFRKKIDKLSF